MVISKSGFTIIEIVVVVGITMSLMVAVGGIMTSSFRLKNSSDSQVLIQNQAQIILDELKKNVFDANIGTIDCPTAVGSSLSFDTKSGGNTTLKCDMSTSKVASVSAQVGEFNLTNNLLVNNCSTFVSCEKDSSLQVTNINFTIGIDSYTFSSKVVPR